jgi:hypothetical protein
MAFPRPQMVPGRVESDLAVRAGGARKRALGKRFARPFLGRAFLASVRVCENTDAIVSYSLKFADAAWELGAVPYGKHLRRPDWFLPVEWLFTFSKEAVEGEVSQPT